MYWCISVFALTVTSLSWTFRFEQKPNSNRESIGLSCAAGRLASPWDAEFDLPLGCISNLTHLDMLESLHFLNWFSKTHSGWLSKAFFFFNSAVLRSSIDIPVCGVGELRTIWLLVYTSWISLIAPAYQLGLHKCLPVLFRCWYFVLKISVLSGKSHGQGALGTHPKLPQDLERW